MADRYQVYLVDLENEKFSAPMQPGMEIDYGNDAISGTLSGFQFFDEDRYLLGTAANYGIRARSNDEGDVFALYRLLGDKAIG